jgi:Ca-activated chloride channel family protein
MNWGNPTALYLLLLFPIFIIFLVFFAKQRKRQLLKFCDEALLAFHNKNFSGFYFNLSTALLMIAFFFMVIALARPQWDREVRIIDTMGQDIVFLIDVSKSMDAVDISPTRLERAKTHINLFLDELRGDRVAIVAFAGSAAVICPLTTDYAALKLLVSSLSTETITNYGTNIGAGLTAAAEVFDKEATSKTIILLSDGEDHEKTGLEVARKIAQDGIRVYSIGIGTPGGSPIEMRNASGRIEYVKDSRGEVIISYLSAEDLHNISQVTDGRFYSITPSFSEIFEILKQIQHNEKTKFSTRQYYRYSEQFHIFLIISLIMIILSGFISYKHKHRENHPYIK